jgi:hypothetical protein
MCKYISYSTAKSFGKAASSLPHLRTSARKISYHYMIYSVLDSHEEFPKGFVLLQARATGARHSLMTNQSVKDHQIKHLGNESIIYCCDTIILLKEDSYTSLQ